MRMELLVVVLLGCGTGPNKPSSPSDQGRSDRAGDKQLENLFPAPSGDTMTCKRDNECQSLPCGPCIPDTVIDRGMLQQECVVNPCTHPGAHCTSGHLCVVN